MTNADRLAAICAASGATYERVPLDGGRVSIRITTPAGESFAGVGATTTEAILALETRLAQVGGAR